FYVRTRLVAFDNVAQTARNIMAHERLFRLGSAGNLTVFAIDVVLIIALYTVLRPVNRYLALLATGWGLIETATLAILTLRRVHPDGSVRILVHHLSRACEGHARSGLWTSHLLFRADHGLLAPAEGITTFARRGAIFFAVGTLIFSYLFLRGRMVPASIAWLG